MKIFDEMYRIDKSRNVEIEGSGLGLPISKKIIQLQGGRIWAECTGTKINLDTINPDGGVIIRDSETNEPTGVLLENAAFAVKALMLRKYNQLKQLQLLLEKRLYIKVINEKR